MKKLIIAAAIACCYSSAYAAGAQVSAAGDITATCSFGTITNGVLAVNPAQPGIISTKVGGSAQVGVHYIGTPTVTLTKPTAFDAAPPGATGATFLTDVSSPQATFVDQGANASATYTMGNSDFIKVDMGADFGAKNVPVGTYRLTAQLTCQ